MQKLNMNDVPYSATYNSQSLTFVDNDFLGVDNTQATDFNYELTFSNDPTATQSNLTQNQFNQQSSMMEGNINNNNNNDADVNQVVRDLNTLNFEDDEEEMYNVIDLPKHACA